MAYSFDGNGDSVHWGDRPVISDATTLTGCGWCYNANLTTDHYIVGNRAADGINAGFELFTDDVGFITGRTNTYNIAVDDGANDVFIEGATNAALQDTWQHVLFSFSPNVASGLELWIDGVEDANSPVSTVSVDHVGQSNEVIQAGEKANGTRDRNGRLAEIAFWDRVLSDAEKTALGRGYSPLHFRRGLIFYDPMIRGLRDRISGTAGTVVNNAAVIQHPRMLYPRTRRGRAFPADAGAPVTFNPAWARGSNVILQPGIQ